MTDDTQTPEATPAPQPTAIPPGDMTDREDDAGQLAANYDPPPVERPKRRQEKRSMSAQERREEGDDLSQTVRRLVSRAVRHGCPMRYALGRIEGEVVKIRQEADRASKQKSRPSAPRSAKAKARVQGDAETNPGHPSPQTVRADESAQTPPHDSVPGQSAEGKQGVGAGPRARTVQNPLLVGGGA